VVAPPLFKQSDMSPPALYMQLLGGAPVAAALAKHIPRWPGKGGADGSLGPLEKTKLKCWLCA